MPTYNFRNNETGEEVQMFMRISEMLEWKEQNPEWTSFFPPGTAPRIVGGTGGFKNDDGWKENLSRIAEAHPSSALAEKVGGRTTKAAKTAEVAKKHNMNKGKYNMDL
jgi:hypothetical protein